MIDPSKRDRMLSNAVRTAILVAEDVRVREYLQAVSDHDTIEDFKALHRELSPPLGS